MIALEHKETLLKEWRLAHAEPPSLPIWRWAEEHIIVPRRSGTPFPGPYSTAITPWVRGWFDAIQDPDAHTIAIEKGAQVSATLTAYISLAYWIKEDPDPVLVVMPAQDDAKSASKLRVQPMIEDSPYIAQELTDNPDDFALTEYTLRSTVVRWIGSNSPGKAASFPHRYIILDEPDKYREQIGREGSTISNIFQRAKMFWNRKRIMPCTPTTAGGFIHRFFLQGDQRKFFVPCPHCQAMQVLVFGQVKFRTKSKSGDLLDPIDAGKTAYYECESCKKRIEDTQKPDMISRGEWRSTAKPQLSGFVSFHLSGLYSPSEECTFSAITEKFLKAKRSGQTSELQEFINNDLGEIWEDVPEGPVKGKDYYAIRDRWKYPRGTCPSEDPFFLVMTVDVQGAFIVWCVWGFGPGDLWLVDNGIASTLPDLHEVAAGPYLDHQGGEHTVALQLLDSGHRTTEVYRYCTDRRDAWALKGDTGLTTRQSKPVRFQEIKYLPGQSKKLRRPLLLRHIHPSYFKEELLVAVTPPADDEALLDKPCRIWFHDELEKDFVTQMMGEVPIETDPDKFGSVKRYWREIHHNHYFDCTQYAFAARWMLRKDLVRLGREAQRLAKLEEEREKETDEKKTPQIAEPFVNPNALNW